MKVAVFRVELDLSHHCVETAARREHRRLCQELLAHPGAPAGARQQLQLLQRFLEQTDFAALRARRPELAGGTPGRVILTLTAEGEVRLTGQAPSP